jgi:cell fate (sporulation/competence/biofilm development) regulator YmcA (YheA/YmcA/DUF963 family)
MQKRTPGLHYERPATTLEFLLRQFEKYKAYKFTNHQLLSIEDKIKRTDFCEKMFNLINDNEDILEKIVFTDEASFTLDDDD